MRVLAIGDFHGKVPTFLPKAIKKEKPDLIVSPGDFCAFYERKLFFKYSYESQLPLELFIGDKKTIEYTKRDNESGRRIIKYLKKLHIPLVTVLGNVDPAGYADISSPMELDSDIFAKYKLHPLFKREENNNFKILEFQSKKFKDFVFIGSHKSSYPGYLPQKKWKGHKKAYQKYKKKLAKLFSKNQGAHTIFLSHNAPYRILDLVRDKKAHKRALMTHKGSFLTREIIKKYNPLLCICGHMHENQGKAKLGKTLVVNPGAACDGKYALIDINRNKINVRFKR
jgi:Icc-related predicted phosphoesterase